MKKKLCTLLVLFATLLFSGCASHKMYAGPALPQSYDTAVVKNKELIAIAGYYHQGGWLTPGDDGIESLYYALQLAAEHTLNSNKKFFAVYRPIAISDFDGKGFGTPESFRNKCIIDAAPGGTALSVQAQFVYSYCGTTQVLTSYFEIVEYKKKPKGITSYDAEKTLAMIKADGYYNNEGAKSFDAPNKLDPGLMGYMTWWGSRRSDPREADIQ